MNPLLIRRRGMMQAQKEPFLIYEANNITSPVDTNIQLFSPVISWTILIDSMSNNYSWSTNASSQGLLGLTGNPIGFRLGKIYQGESFDAGSSLGIANLYYAMSCDSSNTNPRCISLYGRYNGLARRLFGIRYNMSTNELVGITDAQHTFNRWFNPSSLPSTGNLLLLVGGITGATIYNVKVYKGLLTDQEMIDYVTNY